MRGYYTFLTGVTLHFIAWGMLEPLIPLYVLRLSGSEALVGVVTSVSSLIPVFAAVWIGAISSRIGARRSLILGGVGTVASFAVFAASGSLWVLVVAQALFGLFHLWRIIPAQAWISYTSGAQLYHNFGYYAFAVTMGQLIGPPFGGWLLEHAGGLLRLPNSDFVVSFLAGGVIMVVSTAVHMFLPAGQDTPEGSGAPKRGWGMGEVLQVARQRDLQILTMLSLLIWMGIALRRSYFPVYLHGVGLSPSRVGLVLATYSAMSLILRPFLGMLVERVGQHRLLYTSFVFSMSVLLLTPFVSSLLPLIGLAACWGISHGTGMPVVMAMATQVVEPAKRGVAVGIRVGANRIGEGLGPLVFSAVTSAFGLTWAFLSAALMMGGGLLMTTFLRRVRREVSGHAT